MAIQELDGGNLKKSLDRLVVKLNDAMKEISCFNTRDNDVLRTYINVKIFIN